MNTKVPAGPATYVGYGFSALLAGLAVLATAEDKLQGTGKWLVILSAALAALTNLNRSLQAPKAGEAPTEAIPSELQSLAAEAQQNAVAVQGTPDGVDSEKVAFAHAEGSQ